MTDNKLTDEEVERVLDAAQKYVSAGLSMTHFQSHNVICGLIAVLRTQLRAPAEKGERAVTREPTEAMYNAARDWSAIAFGKPIGNFAARGCFQAMLDASPQSPPAEPADEQLNWELGEITKSMAVEWPCLPGWTLLPDARGRLSQISNLWAGFKDRLHAEPAAVAKWNHGCMVMAQNIDLWLPNCPQCGMPRPDLAAIPMPGVLPK